MSSTTELLNFYAPLFVEIRDGPPFSDSEKSQRHEDTVAHRPRITFSHYASTCGLSALPAGCPSWASYSHTETAYLTQKLCGIILSFLSKARQRSIQLNLCPHKNTLSRLSKTTKQALRGGFTLYALVPLAADYSNSVRVREQTRDIDGQTDAHACDEKHRCATWV